MATGLAAGIVVGWLAGSVVAEVVPVRERAPAPVPAPGHSIDVAVVAHALLGSMSVVAGAAHTLQRSFDTLTPDERRAVLDRLVVQSDHVIGVLGDVARGLPAAAHDALDAHAVTSRRATSQSDTAAATPA